MLRYYMLLIELCPVFARYNFIISGYSIYQSNQKLNRGLWKPKIPESEMHHINMFSSYDGCCFIWQMADSPGSTGAGCRPQSRAGESPLCFYTHPSAICYPVAVHIVQLVPNQLLVDKVDPLVIERSSTYIKLKIHFLMLFQCQMYSHFNIYVLNINCEIQGLMRGWLSPINI